MKLKTLILCLLIFLSHFSHAEPLPCQELLSIIDRPTIGDSACTVAQNHVVAEIGLQLQQLYPRGFQYNLPETEIRFGLPGKNELVFLLPNYIHQSILPRTGVTASVIGIKHNLFALPTIQGAIEALVTLPTGSKNFGSDQTGLALSGVVSYNITSAWNFTFMLGTSSQSQPSLLGGGHTTSLNPDAVLTYAYNSRINFYGEVYGQTIVPNDSSLGVSSDFGIVYLVQKNLTVDTEIGQRISGALGGFNHYVGVGLVMQL